jgi:hypothetical protein
MFAFAPVGWATDVRRPVMMALALLFVSLAPGVAHRASWRAGGPSSSSRLKLMFCTVASTLLSVRPLGARTDVQGSADLIMGLVAAAAGVVAGFGDGSLGSSAQHLRCLLVTGVVTASSSPGAPAAVGDGRARRWGRPLEAPTAGLWPGAQRAGTEDSGPTGRVACRSTPVRVRVAPQPRCRGWTSTDELV